MSASNAARRRRTWPTPPRVRRRDAALAAMLWLIDVLIFSDFLDSESTPAGLHQAMIASYAAIGYTALVWRRQAPVPVFAIVWVHSVAAFVLVPGYRPTLGVLVGLYTVAAYTGRIRSLVALLAAFVTDALFVISELRTTPYEKEFVFLAAVVVYTLINVAVWSLGRWMGISRRQVTDLEHRRDQVAQEAVAAERRRVARELHDIVAHSVSVIVLQAAGARRVLHRDPARAEQALVDIENVGKQSMVELRRLLNVLRVSVGVDEFDGDIGLLPGLADLTELVNRIRSTGVPVRVEIDGDPRNLDTSVDQSAYRIVQEALTNVVKHAGPGAAATVRLNWAPEQLIVQVSDDGQGVPAADQQLSTGHGLLGLRERALALGGTLLTQRRPNGGFQVTATLPVTEPAGGDAPQRRAVEAPD